MDMKDCNNCLLFRDKFKNSRITKTKTKTGHLLVIIDSLPKNPDGSVNHEDIEFAVNAREAFGEKPL